MKVYLVLLIATLMRVSQGTIVAGNFNINQVLTEWKKAIEPFNTECMCKSGVTQDLLDNLWEHAEIPNDPCFKCAIKCWAERVHVLSPAGVVDKKQFVKVAYGVDTSIADKCGSIRGEDLCQRAYELFLCILQTLQSRYPNFSRTQAWDPVVYLAKR